NRSATRCTGRRIFCISFPLIDLPLPTLLLPPTDPQNPVVSRPSVARPPVCRREIQRAVRSGGNGAEPAKLLLHHALDADNSPTTLRIEAEADERPVAPRHEEQVVLKLGNERARVERRARRID